MIVGWKNGMVEKKSQVARKWNFHFRLDRRAAYNRRSRRRRKYQITRDDWSIVFVLFLFISEDDSFLLDGPSSKLVWNLLITGLLVRNTLCRYTYDDTYDVNSFHNTRIGTRYVVRWIHSEGNENKRKRWGWGKRAFINLKTENVEVLSRNEFITSMRE